MSRVAKKPKPIEKFVRLTVWGVGHQVRRDVVELIRRGEFGAKEVGRGAQGAKEYLVALRHGDVVPDAVAVSRYENGCGNCEAATPSPDGTYRFGYCGPPLRDHMGTDKPTCGCFLLAAVRVASKECPRKIWLAHPTPDPAP